MRCNSVVPRCTSSSTNRRRRAGLRSSCSSRTTSEGPWLTSATTSQSVALSPAQLHLRLHKIGAALGANVRFRVQRLAGAEAIQLPGGEQGELRA